MKKKCFDCDKFKDISKFKVLSLVCEDCEKKKEIERLKKGGCYD